MSDKGSILVPVDGSPNSDRAVKHAMVTAVKVASPQTSVKDAVRMMIEFAGRRLSCTRATG